MSLPSQKANSRTYNFVEVSGHNLEGSQTGGFCLDFLNHRGRGYGFLADFPPVSFTVYSVQCTVYTNGTVVIVRGSVSLKKYKSQGKAVEVTVNSKEENS